MSEPIDLVTLRIMSDFHPVTLPTWMRAELEAFANRQLERAEVPRTFGAAEAEAICEREGERWLVRLAGGEHYRVSRRGTDVTVTRGEPRHYASTVLPTLRPGEDPPRREVLLALYAQVNQSWAQLTDVRFKLLGFIPAVSVIAWIQLAAAEPLRSPVGATLGFLLCLLAVGLIDALRRYDNRNDALYDDLISRGRKIEEELGVDTGVFRGRPKAPSRRTSHRSALAAIYGLSKAGWVLLGVWFVFTLLQRVAGA